MPDLITVLERWWKFIFGVSLLAGLIALVVSLLSPQQYLSEATALPANSLIGDRARIFNDNIQALYSDFGSPDELDRMEGTGALDTLFIAASDSFDLDSHYGYGPSGESSFKAARKLKKNSKIARSAYGELKIKVWDKDREMAAAIANFMMNRMQEIHQQLQVRNNGAILERIRQDQVAKQEQFRIASDSLTSLQRADAEIMNARKVSLMQQLVQYDQLIDQYQLAINTNAPVLLTVEPARASLWHDKPRTLQNILFSIAAAFALTLLMALFMESRKHNY
jgi:uncharacterized protein involved in exopolysaccharide biosynthesis